MRILTLIIAFVLAPYLSGWAQDARVLWQKNIGGSGYDWIDAMVSDDFGYTYILSTVQEGNNHQIHISKLNADGEFIWEKSIGGTHDETGKDIIITKDGNVAAIGASYSKDLYPSVFNKGYSDIFVVKLNPEGDILNLQSYGGSAIDLPSSITERANGNLLVTGSSFSNDLDVAQNKGNSDIWLFEIDATGGIVWSETMGGNNDDSAVKVLELEDESLLLLGNTETSDEEFSANHGDLDIVLFKLSSEGSLEWLQLYGGSLKDFASGVSVLENGNFLVAGTTFSTDGNVFENSGGSDAWLFEADTQGFLQWSKTYGSYGNESIAALLKKDNGFVIFGSSSSSVMNNINNHGSLDFWLYEISPDKEITDEYLFGSSGFDEGYSIVLNKDGSILMGGLSNSKDGLIQNYNGDNDGLLLKIDREQLGNAELVTAHPNPTENIVYLNHLPEQAEVSISSMSGNLVLATEAIYGSAKSYDLSAYPSGVYLVKVSNPTGSQILRVIKN